MPIEEQGEDCFPQINEKYQYTIEDVFLILQDKINDNLKDGVNEKQKSVEIIPLAINDLFEKLQEIYKKIPPHPDSIFLLPVKIKDHHWVGIFLEFHEQQISFAKFISSTPKEDLEKIRLEQTYCRKIQEQFAIELVNDLIIDSPTSSAIYVIENLNRACFNLNYAVQETTKGFRALHVEAIQKLKPELAPTFYLPPQTLSQASFLKPDVKYKYDYNEINTILTSRLSVELNENSPEIPVYVAANVYSQHDNALNRALSSIEDKGARIVLVPCYIDSLKSVKEMKYWIGLLLEFDSENTLITANYTHNYHKADPYVSDDLKSIIKELTKLYPQSEIQEYESGVRTKDLANSAVCMIEGLMQCLNQTSCDHSDHKKSRTKDLMALMRFNRAFFDKFYIKQLENINTDNIETAAAEIDQLFKILVVMHHNSKQVFAKNITSTALVVYSGINQDYETIFDKIEKKFKLKITEVGKSHGAQQVLAVKSYEEYAKTVIASYTAMGLTGLVLGGGIGVAGGAIGGAIAATIAAGEAIAIGEAFALAGGLIALNPLILIIPGLALGILAGVSLTARNYFSRDFNLIIQKAFELSNASDISNFEDPRLVEADAILARQFGGYGDVTARPAIERGFRYLSTKKYQKYFAVLLLANIRYKRLQENCLDIYSYVQQNAQDENLKAMAIIGYMNALCRKELKLNKFSDTVKRNEKIDECLIKLNSEHQQIVQYYFDKVWQSFELLLSLIENPRYIQSIEGFKIVTEHIGEIKHYSELHFLKHMPSNGKLAHVLFSFAQGLSHYIAMQHYKYFKDITNDAKYAAKFCNNREEAAVKFTLVKSLQLELLKNELTKPNSPTAILVTAMNNYIDWFSSNYQTEKLTNNQFADEFREESETLSWGLLPNSEAKMRSEKSISESFEKQVQPLIYSEILNKKYSGYSEAAKDAILATTFRHTPSVTESTTNFVKNSTFN